MGFIERTYTSTIAFVSSAGQSQWAGLAAEIASTAAIASTLLAILVIINMGLQLKPAVAGESIVLVIRLVIVAIFLQNWAQFNVVYSAFNGFFEDLSQSLLQAALGTPNPTNFAQELDNLSFKTGAFANVTAGRMNILGAVMNGIMVVLIGMLGAFATLALIVSQVVLAVLIGLAPLAIVASLSSYTKSFFESWMSATIMMFLYPLILSGIFATVLAMGNATITSINPDADITIGSVIPVIMVVILSILMVILSPVILSLISGSFQLGALSHVVGGMMARPAASVAGSAARGMGGVTRGFTGQQGAPMNAAQRGEAIGAGARQVASDTANFARPSQISGNVAEGVNIRAQQLNRMSERLGRFRNR